VADDQYAASRAIVAKAKAEMRQEARSYAEHLLGNDASERHVAAVMALVQEKREAEAACDYAETRLSEVQAKYESVAQELDYYASKTDGGTWADGAREAAQRIREAHRG
jgi:hypothetical protein